MCGSPSSTQKLSNSLVFVCSSTFTLWSSSKPCSSISARIFDASCSTNSSFMNWYSGLWREETRASIDAASQSGCSESLISFGSTPCRAWRSAFAAPLSAVASVSSFWIVRPPRGFVVVVVELR